MKWQANLRAPIAALTLAVQALAVSSAFAADKEAAPAKPQDASVPFADSNVSDWRADGDSTVYFQDNQRKWYKATLFRPAFDLPFVEAIGIDAGPTGSLDSFGAITVRGQRYPFSAFQAVAGPPDKVAKGKPHGPPKKDPAPAKAPTAAQ